MKKYAENPSPRSPFAIMTLREAAERMGIGQARAQQLEQKALGKLRRHPAIRAMASEFGLLENAANE